MIPFDLQLIFPLLGFILFGEALALVIRIYLIKKGNSGWNTTRNRRYLISDLVSGFVLMLNYFLKDEIWFEATMVVFIVLSIATHFYRIGEYLLKKNHPFCANKVLFFLNNLKLVFLFGLLFASIPF